MGNIIISCRIYIYIYIYIQSVQHECARLLEGVPYVKIHRYNPKHLYIFHSHHSVSLFCHFDVLSANGLLMSLWTVMDVRKITRLLQITALFTRCWFVSCIRHYIWSIGAVGAGVGGMELLQFHEIWYSALDTD
jgi:hypothetical protein